MICGVVLILEFAEIVAKHLPCDVGDVECICCVLSIHLKKISKDVSKDHIFIRVVSTRIVFLGSTDVWSLVDNRIVARS